MGHPVPLGNCSETPCSSSVPGLGKYQDEGGGSGTGRARTEGGVEGNPHNDVTVRDFVPCLRLRGDKEGEEGERLTLDCAHFHSAAERWRPPGRRGNVWMEVAATEQCHTTFLHIY